MSNPVLWKQNKWYGGLSDDDFIGAEGTFAYGENIDIYREPRGIQLSPRPELQTNYNGVLTGTINKILIDSMGEVWLFTSTGEIWQTNVGVFQLRATLAPVKAIVNASEFGFVVNNQIAIFTVNELFRIDMVTFAVVSVGAYQTTFEGIDVVNYQNTFLYWGAGNILYSTDNTYTAITSEITFRNNENVKGLGQFQDQLKIYTTYGIQSPGTAFSFKGESYQYFWNRVPGTQPSNVFLLSGLPVRAIVQDGALDYIISGKDTPVAGLYVFAGTQKKLVHRNNFLSSGNSVKFAYAGGITANKYSNHFGIFPVRLSVARKAIQLYGSYYNGLPYASSLFSAIDIGDISALEASPTAIFFASGSDLYILNLIGVSFFVDEGFVDSLKFGAEFMYKQKKIEEISVAYKIVGGSGDSIDVGVILANGSYVLLTTITDDTALFKRTYSNEFLNSIDYFNFEQIRITLKSATGNTTPTVYECNTTITDVRY